ncbi:glutathione-specific gamma-glutamylcyclotransferase 1 [Haematobia irritans]|uniref:glutathione-specific gamma-glutamylcyclotransferase 1 n=1 Tax=Haematobia irritans TaxID=7368 RepID=UPI003F4F42DD
MAAANNNLERLCHPQALPPYVDHNLPLHFENLFVNGLFAEDEVDNRNNNNGLNGNNEPNCWVFGYGSLCWYPGFEYDKCITGYIRGYNRRFWQGNTTHRGTVEKPGRVATLVEDKEGITWGCAYRITGQIALDYLKQRECTLGGYTTVDTKFYPRIASYDTPFGGEAVPVLVYIANKESEHWLGEDQLENVAKQIVECEGASGHNVEYLLRLARFMHEEIPEIWDDHLFQLETLVLDELRNRDIPLWKVMGRNRGRIRRDSHEDIRRPTSFEFTSRIPERKLRCLNI